MIQCLFCRFEIIFFFSAAAQMLVDQVGYPHLATLICSLCPLFVEAQPLCYISVSGSCPSSDALMDTMGTTYSL